MKNTLVDPRKDDDAKFVQSLVGRTIRDAVWCDAGGAWGEGGYALLVLDDGRTVRFGGWGYDAWGATVGDARIKDEPKSVRDRLDAALIR